MKLATARTLLIGLILCVVSLGFFSLLRQGQESDLAVPSYQFRPVWTTSLFEIARGTFAGIRHVNKFGANANVADGTVEEVWDGSVRYTWPTTATVTHIKQDTDQVADRGLIIEVQGLDANWTLIVQSKALDASDSSTLVVLDTPLRRIFRLRVLGDVVASDDIRAVGPAGVTSYAVMMAGNNQTLMALYTVPDGKTAYITQYYASSILAGPMGLPDAAEFKLWVADRANSYEFQLKHVFGLPQGAAMVVYEFLPYLQVTERSDIKITASPDGDDIAAHAGFDLILVDN